MSLYVELCPVQRARDLGLWAFQNTRPEYSSIGYAPCSPNSGFASKDGQAAARMMLSCAFTLRRHPPASVFHWLPPLVDQLVAFGASLTVVVVEGTGGVAEKRGGDVVVEASDGRGKSRLAAQREDMTKGRRDGDVLGSTCIRSVVRCGTVSVWRPERGQNVPPMCPLKAERSTVVRNVFVSVLWRPEADITRWRSLTSLAWLRAWPCTPKPEANMR